MSISDHIAGSFQEALDHLGEDALLHMQGMADPAPIRVLPIEVEESELIGHVEMAKVDLVIQCDAETLRNHYRTAQLELGGTMYTFEGKPSYMGDEGQIGLVK